MTNVTHYPIKSSFERSSFPKSQCLLKAHKRGSLDNKASTKKNILIYPGMITVRNSVKLTQSRKQAGGEKKVIKGFSNSSRINFMKLLCKLTEKPVFEWEPTFTDDVMEGKTIPERREFSSRVIHNLRRWLKDSRLDIWLTWRREWKPRLSGAIIGELCPHFHMAMGSPQGVDYIKKNLSDMILKFVDLTGSVHPSRFAVAFDPRSYRELTDDRWRRYVSKYVSKESEAGQAEIGRSWGRIGKLPLSDGEPSEISPQGYLWLLRILRRFMEKRQWIHKKKNGVVVTVKAKRRMSRYMKGDYWQGFVMISQTDLNRLIALCRLRAEDAPEGADEVRSAPCVNKFSLHKQEGKLSPGVSGRFKVSATCGASLEG